MRLRIPVNETYRSGKHRAGCAAGTDKSAILSWLKSIPTPISLFGMWAQSDSICECGRCDRTPSIRSGKAVNSRAPGSISEGHHPEDGEGKGYESFWQQLDPDFGPVHCLRDGRSDDGRLFMIARLAAPLNRLLARRMLDSTKCSNCSKDFGDNRQRISTCLKRSDPTSHLVTDSRRFGS